MSLGTYCGIGAHEKCSLPHCQCGCHHLTKRETSNVPPPVERPDPTRVTSDGYACDKCGRVFNRPNGRSRHQNRCDGTKKTTEKRGGQQRNPAAPAPPRATSTPKPPPPGDVLGDAISTAIAYIDTEIERLQTMRSAFEAIGQP